jgi:hypothetical protein
MTMNRIDWALMITLFGILALGWGLFGALQSRRESGIRVMCDMEAGVVCFASGFAMSCLPQSEVEPICPLE